MTTHLRLIFKRTGLVLIAFALVVGSIVIDPEPAKAANYEMMTGSYIGTGVAGNGISGLSFQPNLVYIKSTGATTNALKLSSMPANITSNLGAGADLTTTEITLTASGFTVGTNAAVNTSGVYYNYIAVGGSDCTSTGNFCVGGFTGNNGTRVLTTGFQPEVAIVKRSTAVGATFRTASMSANRGEYFTSTAAVTNGGLFTSFAATSFTVGSTNNANGGTYYWFAFGGSNVAEGTYTGNATDNRTLSGIVGFQTNALFVKNSTSATVNNRRAVFSTSKHFGDHSSYVADAVAIALNMVQSLDADGFQLGSGANTNENTFVHYWFALGGESLPAGSGTYTLTQGTYTGTGSSLSVTGLPFKPDLVLLKGEGSSSAVFRTSAMKGDATAQVSATVTTNMITSLTNDGFTIGTSGIVNTASVIYHWQAFGNAYDSETFSGSTDFAVGTYYGNAQDNRNITGTNFAPDVVVAKASGITTIFRTSSHVGDQSSFMTGSAAAANNIQAFNSDGFQIGSGTNVNNGSTISYWYAFKSGTNLRTGTYTGDNTDNRLLPVTSFRPTLVWVKANSAATAVSRPSTLSGDATQSLVTAANAAGRIKALNGGGFTLGTNAEANAGSTTHHYIAWRQALPETLSTSIVDSGGTVVPSPNFTMAATPAAFSCTSSSGSLGTSSQRLRISNMRISSSWSTSIAPTGGSTARWTNTGATRSYDFNDATSSGCLDGADSDSVAGQLQVSPSGATITPETDCAATNITLGSNQSFSEGSVNTITLATAATGADTACYWDITNVGLTQSIPIEQDADTYQLNMTITTVAS